ncbi:hypothetical protein Tco_0812859, partial [Tanacetum coccineum]
PTIPPSPYYTPGSLDFSPASDIESDPSEDPSSDHIPSLPAISPFLSFTNDTIDIDTPDIPPSPTHDSSSEASVDIHLDASSDSSSRHSLSDHSSPDLPSTSAGKSRKKRRDFGYLADVEAEIDECIAYANDLRDKGIDARFVVEAVDREESKTGMRGPVEVIEGVQREHGRRIVRVESAVIALTVRIAELERDNRRLRGTVSVESQRVDRLQRDMSRMQRELRQMRRLQLYDRVRVGRFEARMPNIRSRASMTHEEIEDLIALQVAEEIEAREAVMNLEPLNENGDEQKGGNGGNGENENGGNGGNGNGGNRGKGNGRNGGN